MQITSWGMKVIQFFDRIFDHLDHVFFLWKSLFEGVGLLNSFFQDFIPKFLYPVVFCMLAISVIMWVVNLF